jgi:hypothetical protein
MGGGGNEEEQGMHNKTVYRNGRIVSVALLAAALAAGCEQPTQESDVEMVGSLLLNGGAERITVFAPTAVEFQTPEFIAPEDITVTVQNTGDAATGELRVRLSADTSDGTSGGADLFEVTPQTIPNLEPGASTDVTVKVPKIDPRKALTYTVNLLVGSASSRTGSKLPIRYTVFVYEPDAGVTVNVQGDALQAGQTATAQAAGRGTNPWFSSNPAALAIDDTGTITAHKSGTAYIGYVVSSDAGGNPTRAKCSKLTAYPAGDLGPVMQSVSAVDGANDITGLYRLEITYKNTVPATDSAAGFSLKNTDSALTFTRAVPGANTLALVMSRQLTAAEIAADNLQLVYDSVKGAVKDSADHIGVSGVIPVTLLPGNATLTVNKGTNLARQNNGVAASAEHSNATHKGVSAVDGDDTTRWATPSNTRDCWVKVTFTNPKTANLAVVKSYGSRVTTFKVEYNNDGGDTWNEAYSYSGSAIPGTTSGATAPFDCLFTQSVTATVFRFHILNASEDPTIWEFELYNATAQ